MKKILITTFVIASKNEKQVNLVLKFTNEVQKWSAAIYA